ncbi:MAG: hypothetical protein Q7T55_25665 [Solirubrobacteraceae bacterium]|nr:hypothetical protein [Solirubrobacteraceae bacterium]
MLFPTALPSLGALLTAPLRLAARSVARRTLRALPRTTAVRTTPSR